MLQKQECNEKFAATVKERWKGCARNVEETWLRYKKCVTEAADEACGWTKGRSRRKVTWWWKEGLRGVIEDKKKKFKTMIRDNTEESKTAYKIAKKEAKKAVSKAMEEETKKVVQSIERDNQKAGEGQNKLFKMARQYAKERKDVVGGQCIKDEQGKLCTDVEDRKIVWKKYMERLLNEENEWNGKVESTEVEGEVEIITAEEVRAALKDMKKGKASGISGVCTEFLLCSGEAGVEALVSICNGILQGESMPQD